MHIELLWLDLMVVVAYIITLLAIGFWVSFKKGHTDDLFLAGRTLGWPNVGLSIFGTNVTPSMLLTSCGVAYSTGMVASNFEWMAWIYLFLLGMVFIPHYMNTRICTMPEFLSYRFDESCRTFLSWYMVVATAVIWLAEPLFIGGLLLSQITGWEYFWCVLLLTVIATSFTVAGGLAAVVITDSFQSILLIGASIALTVIGFYKIGSLEKVVNSVPGDYWVLFRPHNDASYPWHAIVLGYPVIGIWFWCTDQTIVQRVLGARNITQGQLGSIFAAFLKVLSPLIFFLPGIFCRILHPELSDPDSAYVKMVAEYLPTGMVGLIIAVLIAALISTLDSGLNSLSTVFTLDIYVKKFRPNADAKERIRLGRIVTVLAAVVGTCFALLLAQVKDKGLDLFSILMAMLCFFAPPLSAVFTVGVLWRRATKTAALFTLIFGSIFCGGIGICYMIWPLWVHWPHFMLLSFYLFAILTILMIIISLFTEAPDAAHTLPTLRQTYANQGHTSKVVWWLWGLLTVIMVAIYIVFN